MCRYYPGLSLLARLHSSVSSAESGDGRRVTGGAVSLLSASSSPAIHSARLGHDAEMENEILGLDLPAGSLVPELARPGFVCYRDAAGSDSNLLRRSRVPKPSALLPQLSRICFATSSSSRDLPDARAGPALHPRRKRSLASEPLIGKRVVCTPFDRTGSWLR